MIAKGNHIRDGGAGREASNRNCLGFQVSSPRGHGQVVRKLNYRWLYASDFEFTSVHQLPL